MFNKLLTFIKEVHIITNDSKRYDLYISNKKCKEGAAVIMLKTRMAENFKEPLDDYHFDRDHYDSCNLYICIPWFYVGSIRRCRSITSSGSQSR